MKPIQWTYYLGMLLAGAGFCSTVAGQDVSNHSGSARVTATIVQESVWPRHRQDREEAFEASVVVQVDCDGDRPMIVSPAMAILTTSAIIEKAATTALEIDPSKVRESLEVIAVNVGPKMTRLEVRLLKTSDVEWKAGDAEKLIAALVDRLRAALDESAKASSRPGEDARSSWEQQLRESDEKLAEVRAKQQEISRKLRDLPASSLDPESAIRHARSQLQTLESQIRHAEEQLARKDPGALSLLEEWEELVKLRAEKVEDMKREDQPASDVKDAELQLAEARAKLAEIQTGRDGRSYRSEAADAARAKAHLEMLRKQRAAATEKLAKAQSPEVQAMVDEQRRLAAVEDTLRQQSTVLRSRGFQINRQPTVHYFVTLLDGVSD